MMKHMKMDKGEAAMMDKPAEPEQPRYPYGLNVRLDEASIKKVGFENLPKVGETLHMEARVKVVSVSASESNGGKNRNVELQITHLGFEDAEETRSEPLMK